jgi:hypothetical protein
MPCIDYDYDVTDSEHGIGIFAGRKNMNLIAQVPQAR